MVTNAEFARLTGCNYTMASKIRNGARMPSGALFSRIVRVFDLNGDAAVEAYAGGRAGSMDKRRLWTIKKLLAGKFSRGRRGGLVLAGPRFQ